MPGVRVHLAGRRARWALRVSLATIRSSQGRNGAPGRKPSSAAYALTNASCTTSSASPPAPRSAAVRIATGAWRFTSSAYASRSPPRTRARISASSGPAFSFDVPLFLDLSTPPGGDWFPLSSIRLFEKPGDGVDVRRAPALQVCLALALTAAVLAGCTSEADPAPAPAPNETTTPAPATPVPLSLLVFNVEYGGSRATDAVLADLDADVVGVLESYNRLPEIAEAAGYPYYDVGLQILSKYPILEPSGADGLYAFIEVRPGEAVALVNTHLDYVQDGPNRLERGVPVADVLASEEEVRLSSIEKLLPSATRLLDEGWPVLFTGDLNEPSHLEGGPIAWPVSEALAGAGLRDAYREAHPDPAADPGHTWGGVAGGGGSPRRIDYAYVGGPVEVDTSEVVGEQGGDSVDLGYPRWTSDHRAVLSQLTIDPAPIPTTVALSSRMLTVGDDLTVTYRMPEASTTARSR